MKLKIPGAVTLPATSTDGKDAVYTFLNFANEWILGQAFNEENGLEHSEGAVEFLVIISGLEEGAEADISENLKRVVVQVAKRALDHQVRFMNPLWSVQILRHYHALARLT